MAGANCGCTTGTEGFDALMTTQRRQVKSRIGTNMARHITTNVCTDIDELVELVELLELPEPLPELPEPLSELPEPLPELAIVVELLEVLTVVVVDVDTVVVVTMYCIPLLSKLPPLPGGVQDGGAYPTLQ